MEGRVSHSAIFAAAVLCAASVHSAQLRPALELDGVKIDAGAMGVFTLSHPLVKTASGERPEIVERRRDGDAVALAYKDGSMARVRLDGTRATYEFVSRPSAGGGLLQEMYVPLNYNEGGGWILDGREGKYPAAKGDAKLHQGGGGAFAVAAPDGSRLSLKFSSAPYVEVQDNREWNWGIFWTGFHFWDGLRRWTVDFSLDLSQKREARLLDRFGQTAKDFPGKVASEAELAGDVRTEDAFYSSLGFAGRLAESGVSLDSSGGVAGTGGRLGLSRTGFFHCEKKSAGGRERWFLVDPEGNAFFHLGVCCFAPGDDFTDITERRGAFEWLPPREGPLAAAWMGSPGDWWNGRAVSFYKANVVRKYGAWDEDAFSSRMIDRARSAGFNSIGAFSPHPAAAKRKNFPYVGMLGCGKPRMIPGVRGVFDPYDAASRAEVEKAIARIASSAGDRLLIGYFIENEQAFEELPKVLPSLGGDWAAKRAFAAHLEARYGTIAAFNGAWGLDEPSFAALVEKGLAVSTPAAKEDVRSFCEKFLEEYYSLVERNFRAADPNHMLLGSRWQPQTAKDETLCRVAGRHLDIVSVNYYATEADCAFMKRIYEATGGRPQFWSEFYFTSAAESNCAPSGSDFPTQRERGKAYRRYLEAARSCGFVTGVEWFTLVDQAATGRYFEGPNGERCNTGLFNVADRPYADMLREMRDAHADLHREFAPVKVILDTDMISDYDDMGALACLHAMADAGECEILATLSCTRANGSVAAVEICNAYYGRPDIPVGCSKLASAVSGRDKWGHKKFLDLQKKYPGRFKYADSDDAPDAVDVYRRVLASQPDGSVVICSLGFLSNMRALLESKPDAHSPLGGKELVTKKVKKWVAMACFYPEGHEYNSDGDPVSSRIALKEWPTPVTVTDFQYGRHLYAGRAIVESAIEGSPVKDVFKADLAPREKINPRSWDQMAGHPSWDESAVLIAVRGEDSYFAVENGFYEMLDDHGHCIWRYDPSSPSCRVLQKTPRTEVGALIDSLMLRSPANPWGKGK